MVTNKQINEAHVEQLRKLCWSISPNTETSRAFDKMLAEMVKDRCEPDFKVKELAAAIVSGIAYGNWPS